MKIVLFPGVAIEEIGDCHKYFFKEITKRLNGDGEIVPWEIGNNHPTFDLPLKGTREFICKVILDFQTVIVHALEMKVPDADVYLGHSAGSIIALAQKDKNCVTFGSPATLVECIRQKTRSSDDLIDAMDKGNRKILNIINKYDVIAYPINKPNVENFKYQAPWYNPLSFFPATMHSDYWKSETVIKKIVKTIKTW